MTQNNGAAAAKQGEGNTENQNDGKPTAEQIAADQRKRAEIAEESERVAKQTIADLQKQLELAQKSGGSDAVIPAEAIAKIAEKHNVDPDFAKDLASVLLTHSVAAAEAKFIPMFKNQEEQAKKERIESEFNKAFDTATSVEKYKGLAIDKDSVRTLQLANPTQTVEQIVERLYGAVATPKEEGKDTTEDARNGAQRGGGTIDFEKVTPEQREQIMADPEAKKQYFAYLDSKGK